MSRLRSTATVLGLGFSMFTAEALYSGNDRFYRDFVMPILHRLIPDGERAHRIAITAISYGLFPRKPHDSFSHLSTKLLGIDFEHPVGLAAGFDKDGTAFMGLLDAGFSFVEVGTVTPLPQLGNPRPRVFRWKQKEAVINRYGFNSEGHDAVYERLKDRPWSGKGIVGVNLGCNKTSPDPVADFVAGVEKFGNVADYLVINVSSPNTPGLRTMQQKENLHNLLSQVLMSRSKLTKPTPILLKISPDESDDALKQIVQTALDPKTRIDGLIVSNTTLATYEQASACKAIPPSVSSKSAYETQMVFGGLSGPPLRDCSTACLKKVAQLSNGQLLLIGVGGISNGQDAAEKLAAGAQLVQLYTSLIYQGTPVAHRVAKELSDIQNNSSPSII